MFFRDSFRLVIVVCLFHICYSSTYLCPPPEDAFPCWCDEHESTITLYCSNLDTSSQVYKGLHKLTSYKIAKVVFWRCMIEDLAPHVFRGLDIENVAFQTSLIPYNPPQFLGLENSLRSLDMFKTFTRNYTMRRWSLSHLQNLRFFSIQNNIIPEIGDDWIESPPPNLMMLTLDNNNIEKLGDNVFAKFNSVSSIYINDNKITELKRSMFPRPAEKLRSIVANYNNIHSLSADLFEDLNLQTIQLESNKLVTLDEKTWSKALDSISRIYLIGNPFVCNSSLRWLASRRNKFTLRFEGECESPENLRGKSLKDLNSRDFN